MVHSNEKKFPTFFQTKGCSSTGGSPALGEGYTLWSGNLQASLPTDIPMTLRAWLTHSYTTEYLYNLLISRSVPFLSGTWSQYLHFSWIFFESELVQQFSWPWGASLHLWKVQHTLSAMQITMPQDTATVLQLDLIIWRPYMEKYLTNLRKSEVWT